MDTAKTDVKQTLRLDGVRTTGQDMLDGVDEKDVHHLLSQIAAQGSAAKNLESSKETIQHELK